MSNPTNPFNWQMPTATDLVTDLPADFEVFGQAVATSMADLLGGTTGQILSKNSNTDMDFVWTSPNPGDITGITATSPLTGGGTSGDVTVGIQAASTTQSGAVQLTDSTSSTSTTTAATPNAVKTSYDLAAAAIPKSTATAKGNVFTATASATPTVLTVGTNGQVLTADSTTATGLAWATPTSTAFVGCSLETSSQTISNNTDTYLPFTSELYDTDSMHSTSTNTSRITIPAGKGGYYEFRWSLQWASNTAGNRRARLVKNGSTYELGPVLTVGAPNGGLCGFSNSSVVSTVAGDYWELQVFQDCGSSLATGGAGTLFQATKVG